MKDENWIEEINKISPLDLPSYLQECDFYDRQSGEELLREIDAKYTGKEGTINAFVAPAFLNILTNIGRELDIKPIKNLMKMGLTPDRVVSELSNFSYEDDFEAGHVNENDLENFKRTDREYKRDKYEDKKKLKEYRDEHFKNDQGNTNKTGKDEYTDGTVYNKQADAKKRNYEENYKHTSDIDHIVPLSDKFKEISNVPALSDEDIKRILNTSDNYATTNSTLNRSKGDSSNSKYVEDHPELDEKTKRIMLEKEKAANKALNKDINQTIVRNVGKDSANNAIGDVILLGIKASYYEVTESIRKGVTYKTNVTTKIAAFTYRIKRVFKYVLFKLKDVISSNVFQFIKSLLINFASLLIGFLTDIFKNIAKIVIGGIDAIIQAVKILTSPSETMTAAQKADAVVKLVASTAVLFIGDITKTLLSKVGIPEKFVGIANAFVLGILAAFIGYALDKIDLFGAKIDTRIQRVNEIFNERINEIENDTEVFKNRTIGILKAQKEMFGQIREKVIAALDNDDSQGVVDGSYEVAKFLGVDIEYSNTEEFKEYLGKNTVIEF